MATITFTTRCTNETVSLPSEEAIERLFADADEWFAFQHRAPETEMELFFARPTTRRRPPSTPYSTRDRRQWRANGHLDKRGWRNRHPPRRMASGMYEDWEKTDRTALLSDINRMACRPMGAIGAPTLGEVREYGDCLWNVED